LNVSGTVTRRLNVLGQTTGGLNVLGQIAGSLNVLDASAVFLNVLVAIKGVATMMLSHHSKMTHHVVLDADWFVVNKVRYFKAIAFFAPTLGVFGELTLSLPPGASVNRKDLLLQARCSHELDWHCLGSSATTKLTRH